MNSPTNDGVPKIADFGLARSLAIGSDEQASGPVIRFRVLVDTSDYVAPEPAAASLPATDRAR